ncbi:MAG: rubrerythrin family protein [Halobacteriaceae archaeon]
MDADTLVAGVQDARETELDRLASDRRLLAVTGADLSRAAVLRAAAQMEAVARDTFESWAADEPHDRAAAAFRSVAEAEASHLQRVLSAGDELAEAALDASDVGALHRYLRGLEASPARVGAGLIGRPLVGAATQLQFVSFFVNEADSQRADLFRDLRSETDAQLDRGRALLPAVCDSDEAWETARMAAVDAVTVAYEEYADALTSMGVDPKPIC